MCRGRTARLTQAGRQVYGLDAETDCMGRLTHAVFDNESEHPEHPKSYTVSEVNATLFRSVHPSNTPLPQDVGNAINVVGKLVLERWTLPTAPPLQKLAWKQGRDHRRHQLCEPQFPPDRAF